MILEVIYVLTFFLFYKNKDEEERKKERERGESDREVKGIEM